MGGQGRERLNFHTVNYYNEFDPNAAAWLRELIAEGLIPDGVVDERSITEIEPHELSGFTQCHFFCGVGGWLSALQLAGFPADRPVWTASLPCQPFSTAGKQAGTGDDRHLWPVFERLVRACKPPVIYGEQVASKLARDNWLPGVRLDLEALGYEVGAFDLCAPCAGEVGEGWIVRGDQATWEQIIIGAPHIRQRLYWVADSTGGWDLGGVPQPDQRAVAGRDEKDRGRHDADLGLADPHRSDELRDARCGNEGVGPRGEPLRRRLLETDGDVPCGGLADAPSGGLGVNGGASRGAGHADECGEVDPDRGLYDDDCGLGDTRSEGPQGHAGDGGDRSEPGRQHPQPPGPVGAASWSDFDIIPCRDGKARRIESGSFPLVAGLPRGVVPSGDPSLPSYANQTAEARALRLKGYGNAICAPLAAAFIRAYLDARSL